MPATDVPDRAKLRRMIEERLLGDAEFEAFCIDYFPDVERRFSSGMDRLAKINLLLRHSDAAKLFARLRELPSNAVATTDPELDAQFEALYVKREAALASGADYAFIDAEIRGLKRRARQGPQLSVGETLGVRYKLREKIGSGGFADVWLAWDRRQEQTVAVKVLHGRYNKDTPQWQRFLRGARIMARLGQRHPGFVKALGDPAEDDGYHYFIMEYLPGGDLRKAVISGALSQEQALRAILTVAEALHFAHEQGLVHRDVKPQNILLDQCGAARLSDLDLVLASDSTGGTHTGPMGTFLYAAPEELDDAKQADRRADVFSLGMTALFALHGKDLPYRVLRTPAEFIAELSCAAGIKRVLLRAVAWDATKRQPTAAQWREELLAALTPTSKDGRLVLPTMATEHTPLRLPLPGERIGSYRIVRRLGQGGTCAIYAAHDEARDRKVAIKILLPELSSYPEVRQQVLSEAAMLVDIHHSGLVGIYEYGELANHLTYVVGEFLEGQTLRQRSAAIGVWSAKQAMPLAFQIASAMEALHQVAIVHGGLKPDEFVFVRAATAEWGEDLKLIDYGSSRLTGRSVNDEDSQPLRGTPVYVSPEQINDQGTLEGSVDVYAFGVMLYELLAGEPPFGASFDFIMQLLRSKPKPLRERSPVIPPALSDLVDRMLDKQPAKRPTMSELAMQFALWVHKLPTD